MPHYRTAFWTAAAAAAVLALAAAPAAARPDDPYPKRDDGSGARMEQRPAPKTKIRWQLNTSSGDDPRFNPAVVDYPTDYPAEAKTLKLPSGSGPARFGVFVPADADVWVDGQLTGQNDRWREFITPPLTPRGDYHYEIRARWREDDRLVEQTRGVAVHANGWASVDFTRPERRTDGAKP
jgi:uncharacterized protein (TIGR03000 family)